MNKIQKTGYLIGCVCFVGAFFVKNLFPLGFLIFGGTFLYNYYLNGGEEDIRNCWHEDILGFYFLYTYFFYQFKLGRFISSVPMFFIVVILLIAKYFYAKKKMQEPEYFNFYNMQFKGKQEAAIKLVCDGKYKKAKKILKELSEEDIDNPFIKMLSEITANLLKNKYNPETVKTLFNGLLVGCQGNWKEALVIFNTLPSDHPGLSYASYFYTRAYALYQQKKLDETLIELNKTIEIDDKFHLAFAVRANVYMNQESYDKAIADFYIAENLSELPPEAYLMRGYCYEQKELFRNALDDYSKEIALNPNKFKGYRYRANLYYFCLKQYDKALKDACKAIELNPNGRDYYVKAIALKEMNKPQEAIDSFNETLKYDSKDDFALFFKAECLEQIGNKKEALACFEAAKRCTLERNDEEREDDLKELDEKIAELKKEIHLEKE